MVTLLIRGIRFAIILFALLHFINYFVDASIIANIQALVGLILLILTGVNLKPIHFKLPIFMMSSGMIIFFVTGRFNVESFQNGLLQMSALIGLLVIVPVVSWVFRQEPYIEEMISLAHKLLNTSRKFYFFTIFFTNILSYFLLFGVISLMHQVISKILRHQSGEAWEYFKGTALLRGFSLSTLWIISIPSFTYTVEAFNASLSKSIIQGFLITIAAMVLASLFFHFEKKRYKINFNSEIQKEIELVMDKSSDKKEQVKKTLEFFFLFITLFGAIFLIYELLNVELILLIPLVIVVWITLYFLIKQKLRIMLSEMKNYYTNDLSLQSYQISVMTSAGVLIFALNQSGIGQAMINEIYSLQKILPFLNMLHFLPFIIIILGFMGLGPLTSMVLVSGILKDISLPYSSELIVLSITSGSALSIMLSPLTMPVIILSDVNGLSPIKNGFKFNYKYSIILYLMVQMYIQMLIVN